MSNEAWKIPIHRSCAVRSYDKKKLPELLTYYESKGCEVLALSEVVKA